MSRRIKRGLPNPVNIQGIGTKVCPECKKSFDWYGEQWVYRGTRNGKCAYFCSYKCWRAEDHRKEAKGVSLLRGGNYANGKI